MTCTYPKNDFLSLTDIGTAPNSAATLGTAPHVSSTTLYSPLSPDPSPPLPLPSSPPPPPPVSLLDSQAASLFSEEEWQEQSVPLDELFDLGPVSYPFRDDWVTFQFPSPGASLPQLRNATPFIDAFENSLRGSIGDFEIPEPLIPAAEVPPPPPPPQHETHRERRARRRRAAAERKKATACHKIFSRLPR